MEPNATNEVEQALLTENCASIALFSLLIPVEGSVVHKMNQRDNRVNFFKS